MADKVTLTIDNQTITVPAGMLVVDAAKVVNVDIPVFCYHPKMEPVGMCRMCLVEIGKPMRDRATGEAILNEDGTPKIGFSPKLETACTTPVSEGMVVITDTQNAKDGRKAILEFLLTSHPLDCPVCDKGGECPLQNLTMEHGPGESRFIFDEKKRLQKHVPLGELIYLDRERCIQCARCVRFEHDIVDDPVIHFFHRGRSLEIQTNSEPGFDSIFSGNTTDICPVGALTTADFRFGARPWEMNKAPSICTHCAVGCNMTYNIRREAKSGGETVIKRAMPRQNELVNEIWLCDKGRLGYHFVESDQRLSKPLVRKQGELVPVSWEEAYQVVEDNLRREQVRMVSLAGGRLSNEDLFNLAQLTRSKNGKNVLYSTMAGGDLTAQVGLGLGSNFSTMGKGDVIFVVASDLHQEAPIWWMRVKQAADRGAKLIVANGRPTRLDKFASHTIRYAYGQEAETMDSFLPGAVVPEQMADAVKTLADANNVVVIYGSDGLGLDESLHLAKSCAKLVADRGYYGKVNNGLLAVWDKANTQGAWDMGFQPDRNLKATLREADVAFVCAADPAGDDPVLAKAIQETDFVVVYELFLTETAKMADVVFPVQAQPEREGSYTNGERRVQRFDVVVNALPGTHPDYRITARIARQLGLGLEDKSPVLVVRQIAQKISTYQNISFTDLARVEEQWPKMGREDLYYAGTSYENMSGLGVQYPTAADRGEELSLGLLIKSEAQPVTGSGVRILPVTSLYDRGRLLQSTVLLNHRLAKQVICFSSALAAKYELTDGELIRISTPDWEADCLVAVDSQLEDDVAIAARSNGLPIWEPLVVQIQRLVTEPKA